ncbi:MAG TPA: leucyl aminopeptidase [Acidimicrobiia bacterium]|nr:leucyl aminopeptidase [Acidimicrobiia bacterium]
MAIRLTVTNRPAPEVRADLLAVPVYADRELGPGADAVDRALDGTLGSFMEESGFEGKPGETLLVPAAGRLTAKAALLVGVGKRDDLTLDGLRRAAAAVARRADKVGHVATTLVDAAPASTGSAAAAQAVAEGVLLGAYQFLEYKSEAKPSALRQVTMPGGADVRRGVERGDAIAHAVIWARDMINEPSGEKSPSDFAAAAKRLLAGRGVTVTVLSEAQLRAQRMGGLLGVGQGSARPPRFLKIDYNPGGRADGRLALVGKGVVFDSGGLSLKTAAGMETMKTDMSGAAAVVATMSVLRGLGVKARVTGYVPLVENMPSGTAIRPGDVLRIRNGKTVEVLNTDAEGRLILADALSLATEDRADAIVDLATLTGACLVALGEKIAGLMTNHDDWGAQVRAAADRAGEPVWPLPLPKEYRKLIDSEIADIKNVSAGGYGGALTAGLFLQEFVGDVPWTHLDIAGPARAGNDDGYLVKGGTGFGVRTLVELVESFQPPRDAGHDGTSGSGRAGRARKTSAPAKKAPAKKAAARKGARR